MKARLLRILAVALGALFIYAGAMKVLDPAAFALDVLNYRILPWVPSAALALYLPWLEIVCGGALILRRGETAALWLLNGLMLVFVIAIVTAKIRGIDVSCGCFGSSGKPGVFWQMIARDLAILCGLLAVLFGTAPHSKTPLSALS
jgi:putative oxidoreductase